MPRCAISMMSRATTSRIAGRPSALASRLEEPVPGLIEGRTEYGNDFGIEVRLGPDQIDNAGHLRTRTPNRRPAPLGSRRGIFIFLVATIQFTGPRWVPRDYPG